MGEENISPLEMERSIFDSEEIGILDAAFTKAWRYVESDPLLAGAPMPDRQSELARCLMVIFKLGEDNPTSLANSAIVHLHRTIGVKAA